MNAKQLVVAAVTVVVIVAAWKVSQDRAPQTDIARESLAPELLEAINTASSLKLVQKEKQTRLTRNGDAWVLANRDNFAANGADVRRTLLQLTELRIIEAKTSDPARYSKLGVNDISDEGASGTAVSVADATGGTLLELIVGNTRQAGGGEQRYVRLEGDSQSWLVEGTLEVPADPIRWVDASVTDIDSDQVREVRVSSGDEAEVHILKQEHDDSFFVLQNIPQGFEAKSKATVSSIGALLLDLRFNDVIKASKLAGLDPLRTVKLTTFDGIIATLTDYELDGKTYTRFGFQHEPSLAVAAATESAADEQPSEDIPAIDLGEDNAPESSPEPELSAEELVARLGSRHADWAYLLPNYKRRMMERKLESLIKEVVAEEAAAHGE